MVESEYRQITTVSPEDDRHYTIIVETTNRTPEGSEYTQILNLFANSPTSAFRMLMNLQQIYEHQPEVISVRLVGVYRRTVLEVIDKKIGE